MLKNNKGGSLLEFQRLHRQHCGLARSAVKLFGRLFETVGKSHVTLGFLVRPIKIELERLAPEAAVSRCDMLATCI